MDGIEAKDGKEAPLRWAHIDIAGSMEVSENFSVVFRVPCVTVLPDNAANTILGDGHDRSPSSVSSISVKRLLTGTYMRSQGIG